MIRIEHVKNVVMARITQIRGNSGHHVGMVAVKVQYSGSDDFGDWKWYLAWRLTSPMANGIAFCPSQNTSMNCSAVI